MSEYDAKLSAKKADLTPYVSELTSRLMATAAKTRLNVDSQGWQLIAEVVSYAASAEQRMLSQQDRIQYLEMLSSTDDLTGIANRRGMKNAIGDTLTAAARHGDTGVLGFVDLDDFKALNDQYGHAAGDLALQHVARTLSSGLRSGDHVARIAGDEFAVILTRCGEEGGTKLLHRLQERINNGHFLFEGQTLGITCSVGAQVFDGATDAAQLIAQADAAMYANKAQRRQSI